MDYPRCLKAVLTQDLARTPVVILMGARQVGKTTLCREIARERGLAYYNLDDRDIRDLAREDPEGLLARAGDNGMVLDEVQRVPDLLLAIKSIVDREQRPGRYLLSGSNQPAVSRAVSESLLGRAAYRTLRPITLGEQRFSDEYAGWSFLFGADPPEVVAELHRRAASSGMLPWRDVVRTGGFPRALSASEEHRVRLLNDYVEIFARRDIRDVLGVESVDRFESFVRLAAARTGQEENRSGLSRDLGIPVNTIRRWIDALARSYLVERIPAWSRNSGERVIKAPKLFMVDSALAMAAARESDPTGFHLETLVASDLCTWRDESPRRQVYHWRLGTGQEVDFVLEEDGRLLPVEIKAASGVDSSDARHLRTFLQRHPNGIRGLLLSNDPEIREYPGRVLAGPWWAVL